MPTLNTGGLGSFEIPTTQLGPIVDKVQSQSLLASLSPERPTLYGNVQAVRMTRKPRAQIVAEGAAKASDEAGWEAVTASPIKFQTTVRFTQEVKWLDEDHRLSIVDSLTTSIGESVGRAVDLIGYHGINPITGERATSVTTFLNQTENRVTAADDPDAELTDAVGLVGAAGQYVADGMAMDPRYAFAVAAQRNPETRQLLNPEVGFGNQGGGQWRGLTLARSTAVSGQPEASDTNLRALVGDYSQVRWGFQRRIPVEVIEYGDPDGGGDLKNVNEIAYRAEGVIYVAVFDLNAFSAVDGASAPGGED